MVAKGIPGTKKPGLLTKKWVAELFSGIPPFVIAVVGSLNSYEKPETRRLSYWLAGAAVWLLFSTVWKILHARTQDAQAAQKNDHEGLRGALCVLQAAAGRACGLDPTESSDTLRVTFHRVVPPLETAEQIEQIVDYVGGGGGGAGRTFSVRSGITGRCIRTKEPWTMHRESKDVMDYRRVLATEWGYTAADAAAVAADRYSLMAVPVLDSAGQHALGVIYLDSEKPDLFVDTGVQTAIIEACAGVARFVGERY
jgi:hypothetical protein